MAFCRKELIVVNFIALLWLGLQFAEREQVLSALVCSAGYPLFSVWWIFRQRAPQYALFSDIPTGIHGTSGIGIA
jgi:hypothetical protein